MAGQRGRPSSWDLTGPGVRQGQAVSSSSRPHGHQGRPASRPGRLTGDSGRRKAWLPEAASPGAGCPCHHHRFGGSSATLLLNKVISSRCTMGTSRMTLVRPSCSRGKMTTFSAGRSAWKLNQRQAVSGGALAVRREGQPAGCKASPDLPPADTRLRASTCGSRRGGQREMRLLGGGAASRGHSGGTHQEAPIRRHPSGGLRSSPAQGESRRAACPNRLPRSCVAGAPGSHPSHAKPHLCPQPGQHPQGVEGRDRQPNPRGHRPPSRGMNSHGSEAVTLPDPAAGSHEPPSERETNGCPVTSPPFAPHRGTVSPM